MIRDYSVNAAINQEEILDAFEGNVTKDGWPYAVMVHFRGRQLKDAINSLKETVSPGTIRFRRNGRGDGVLWTAADPA